MNEPGEDDEYDEMRCCKFLKCDCEKKVQDQKRLQDSEQCQKEQQYYYENLVKKKLIYYAVGWCQLTNIRFLMG